MFINKTPKNPVAQLNYAESKPKEVMKELDLPGSYHVDDLYKQENYEYKTPGWFNLGWFAKKLNAGEVLDRLGKGKNVVVEENVQLRGTYSNRAQIKDRLLNQETVKTTLASTEDLESFARVEGGGTPKNDMEEVAQLLEKVEYNKVPGKTTFYEVLDLKGKTISSTEAAKKLNKGEVVQLRERELKGQTYKSYSGNMINSYTGQLAVDPNDLGPNQKYIVKTDCYGVKFYYIETKTDKVSSSATDDAVPFSSMDQLKNFLTGDEK